MEIIVNDTELGKQTISNATSRDLSKLGLQIKRKIDMMKPSLLTQKPVETVIPKDDNHKHTVETF